MKKCLIGALFFSLLFVLLVPASAVNLQDEKMIHIISDYPIAENLNDMAKAADLIVSGKYTGLNSTWNMARNPKNLYEEDPENYIEGLLYDFTVDNVIKGKLDKTEILVNHEHFSVRAFNDSTDVVDQRGIIIKKGVTKKVKATIQNDLYIEPVLGDKYVLFLDKDKLMGNYYGAVEPFSIRFPDGKKAVLESNLIGNKKRNNATRIRLSSGRVLVIESTSSQSIQDSISGRSYDEVLSMMKSGK